LKITLTYQGILPASKRPPEKIDQIRQEFHRQLNKIWGRDQLAILEEWRDNKFSAGAPDFRKQFGNITYLPIASEEIHARVRLTLTLYKGIREDHPAYSHGDIDNRAKSIIDALCVPVQQSRIPNCAPLRDTICLMSDDSLVDTLTVETASLLAENDPTITLAVVVADILPAKTISPDTLSIFV
jgi:hypothetical protein